MVPASIFHRSFDKSPVSVCWNEQSTITGDYPTTAGTVSVKHGRLLGGKAEGIEVVYVDTGAVRALILPTRGMGIWKLWVGEIEFGWDSPVDGPVHPSLVPVMDPSGLGWLEGFDELVVRCGLESNGAPDKDPSGALKYPLHGRIANLPARDLRVHCQPDTGLVEIIGDVYETRLFFNRLRLTSRIGFHAGSTDVHLVDEVTNQRGVPTTVQMLYHINIGAPILCENASVELPIDTLAPKDTLSAGEIDQWNQMPSPQDGYAERVYFAKPHADESGWTAAMLRGPSDQADPRGQTDPRGLGVKFNTKTLPYFILWKNPASSNDGYVIGLEPATNLPNTKTFESQNDRVVPLGPGATVRFELSLHPLATSAATNDFASQVARLSQGSPSTILKSPKQGWTP